MAARNPFPGMNPYLEARWGDVHARLVAYAADQLQPVLPDDLRARMQERVFIESVEPVGRSFYPDVHVYERRGAGAPRATPGEAARVGDGPVAIAEPLVIHVPGTEITECYVEIVDARSGGRVVTVIEFVSRSNKTPGPGRDLYRAKQADTSLARANLVEIDLLRAGQPVTLVPPHLVPAASRTLYHVSVRRGARPDALEYYPMPLRERLPAIKVPLRPTDADVALDVQALVDLAYERGRYDDIDYGELLDPPLAVDDAAWTHGVLESAETRPADR
jgi:hypothetical protein